MKRTALKRKKGAKRVAPRSIAYTEELRERSILVLARCDGICEVRHFAPVEHIHHRLRRSQGGKNELDNLLGLCRPCHDWIHRYPGQSYEMGYMLRRL